MTAQAPSTLPAQARSLDPAIVGATRRLAATAQTVPA